jgi:hypothetical protein
LIIVSEAHEKAKAPKEANFTKLNQEEYKHHQQQPSMIPT